MEACQIWLDLSSLLGRDLPPEAGSLISQHLTRRLAITADTARETVDRLLSILEPLLGFDLQAIRSQLDSVPSAPSGLELSERAKELAVVHQLVELVQQRGDWRQALPQMPEIIAGGFLRPGSVGVSVSVGQERWSTPAYVHSSPCIAGDALTSSGQQIRITVCYQQAGDHAARFLPEEQQLVSAAALILKAYTDSQSELEVLSSQHEALQSLLQAMEDYVLVVDSGCLIRYANPALERDFGPAAGARCHMYLRGLHSPCPWCDRHAVLAGATMRSHAVELPGSRVLDIMMTPIKWSGDELCLLQVMHDVSGERELQSELQRSRQQYAVLFDQLPIAAYLHDLQGRLLRVNTAGCHLVGYRREELLELTIGDLNTTGEILVGHNQQPTSGDLGREVAFRHKDGTTLPVVVTSATVMQDGSRLILTTAQDISERKLAEEALRDSEEYNRSIIKVMPDIIVRTNLQGEYLDVLVAPGHKLVQKPDDLIGKLIRDVLPDTASRPVLGCIARALETGQMQSIEYERAGISGMRWAEARITPFDGRDGEVLALIRDITARKGAEAALLASERYNRSMLEVIPDLVVRTNRRGQYLDVSEAADRRFSQPGAQLLGSTVSEVHSEEVARLILDAISAALDSGDLQTIEYPRRGPGGERWAEARIAPLGADEALSLIRDITDRKVAEDDLRRLSYHDSLSGLHNRRYLEEEMERLLTSGRLPVSIIMADVNGLKVVNDTYGHQTGDEMLKQAAAVLTAASREGDVAGRWGGDEFVLLLPETTGIEAEGICARIGSLCDGLSVEDLPLSLGLGVSSVLEPGHSLQSALGRAEDAMYQHKTTSRDSHRRSVLDALLNALSIRGLETRHHVHNMERMAMAIGDAVGLPLSEMERLRLLVSLHDIGKIAIPESILTKPGPLNEAEWRQIRQHPEVGHRIARGTPGVAHIADDILAHHERWDGSGYPRGLQNGRIPFLARIVAISDAYEVMSNGRPYKPPMSEAEMLEEFRRCSGTQFDPELVDVLIMVWRH